MFHSPTSPRLLSLARFSRTARTRRRLSRRLLAIILFGGSLFAISGQAQIAVRTASRSDVDLFQMDLEALMDVRITGATGLTATDFRRSPVAMTQLGARDIASSGAVDLNHALELFVPNAQFIHHHHLQSHLGFRGTISDREDKYLYQVNGRTMNNWMLLGADNERALPLLGDIHSVDIVRGPASATHGAGAVAGVIDVATYNGLTFQGSDLTFRQGFGDDYTAVEVRHGAKLNADSGFFIYYGLADMRGADSDYYIGRSYAATNGLPANVAGQPVSVDVANLGTAGFGDLWHKFHVSYTKGPLEFWGRFVQDGGQDRPMREIYSTTRPASISLEEWTRGRQFRNRQFTGTIHLKQELSPQWSLDLSQTYFQWAFKDQRAGVNYTQPERHAHETELNSRAIALWRPTDRQSLAFGTEYSHIWFHNPSYSDALDRAPAVLQRKWQVDMASLLAEHQWKLGEQWTSFLSYRTDKHTYTGWLHSPRASLIFTPTDRDTLKLMAGVSVRRGGDEELWSQWARSRTMPKPESLHSYEISYQRALSDQWRVGVNAFYQNYEAIGWIPALYYSSSIGEFDTAGGELELSYTSGATKITFSESLTKLVSADLPSGLSAAGQAITAQPYGYGNDLAEWSPFITKLAVTHDFSKTWAANGSVVHYSGFPGAQDYARYAASLPLPPSAVPVSDPGYTDPYGPNLYANLGLEFRFSRQWTVRLDSHNLAALADKKLSKRNYYFRLSEFSTQPASLTLTFRRRF